MNLNQFITEVVLKECWHEMIDNPQPKYKEIGWFAHKCKNCEGEGIRDNRDFTTPNDWWYLWEFCIKQNWWNDFLMSKYEYYYFKPTSLHSWFTNLVDLKAFPEAIARFHGYKEE
jgi:hypothetical protein